MVGANLITIEVFQNQAGLHAVFLLIDPSRLDHSLPALSDRFIPEFNTFCRLFLTSLGSLRIVEIGCTCTKMTRHSELYVLFRDCLVTVILTTVTDTTSTVGSGATVFTYSRRVTTPWRSVVKMTRGTVLGHVRLEGIFNTKIGGLKCTCLMIRRMSKSGGIKHTCQVITLESRSGVSEGAHLLIRQKPQVNLFNLLLRWSTFGKQCA